MSQQAKEVAGKAVPWRSGVAWWLILVEGIVLLALGSYMLIWSDDARKYSGYLIAAFLFLTGGLQLFRGVRMRGKDKMAGTAMWRGGAGVLTAVLLFVLRQLGVLTLESGNILLAAGLLLYGLMGLYLGLRIKTAGGRPWGSILTSLLVTILGGVLAYGVVSDTDIVQIVGGVAALFGVLLIIYSFVRRSTGGEEETATETSGTAVATSAANNVYQMRQKMASIGDDYYIEDGQGNRVYHVDGKALRIRKRLIFEDMYGRELCQIQEKMLTLKDTMVIEREGNPLATVKKAVVDPVRERFVVKVENGPDIDVQGNMVDHEYKFELNGKKIAEVSKKWFSVRDTYGVEIIPGQNDIMLLAATVAIDQMAHRGN